MTLVAPRRAYGSGDLVAGTQLTAADLRRGDVHVLARLPVRLGADEATPVRQHVEDAAAHVLLALRLARVLEARGLVVVVAVVRTGIRLLFFDDLSFRLSGRVLVERHLGIGGFLLRGLLLGLRRGIGTAAGSDDLLDQLLLAETAEAFEAE